MLAYTLINHTTRKKLDLSHAEYVLVDMIYHLSIHPASQVIGWCYMAREAMSAELGMTKRGTLKMIDRLIAEGVLVKDPKTHYLKTTDKWLTAYLEGKVDVGALLKGESVRRGEQSSPKGEQSSPETSEQSSPNKNRLNKNRDNGSCNNDAFFDSLFDANSVSIEITDRIVTEAIGHGLPEDQVAEFISTLDGMHFKIRPKTKIRGLDAVVKKYLRCCATS